MAEEFVIEKFAFKMVLRGIGIVLLIAALLYPLDFAVWRVRVARGGGMGSVKVDLYTVADLKGGKEELLSAGDGRDAVQQVDLSAGGEQSLLVGGDGIARSCSTTKNCVPHYEELRAAALRTAVPHDGELYELGQSRTCEAIDDADAEGLGVEGAAGGDGHAVALELAVDLEGEVVGEGDIEACRRGRRRWRRS